MSKLMNLTNKKFARLTALNISGKNSQNKPVWKCLCECGKITNVSTAALRNGKTKSCGCLRKEAMSNYKHGCGSHKNKTKEYRIHQGIIQRCCNENAPSYHNYGGRGIKICDRWRINNNGEGFINFLKDMGNCPSCNHSIDRIDNNAGYHPDNCRWATAKEQCNNTRHTRLIEYKGSIKSIVNWARELEVSSSSIINQLKSKTFDDVFKFYNNKKLNKSIDRIEYDIRKCAEDLEKYILKFPGAIKIENNILYIDKNKLL